MNRTFFKWLVKAFASASLAFMILNLLTVLYRGTKPVIADETMSTPAKHVPNSFFSFMKEGFSIGFFDENGFNNTYPSKETINYLFMGSSYFEGINMMPNKNACYCLNEFLDKDNIGEYAYNIGMSGVYISECIKRLPYAIKTFAPSKAVILETGGLDFTQSEIENAIQDASVGELEYSYLSGVLGILRKLPYLRLAYIQLEELLSGGGNGPVVTESISYISDFDEKEYRNRITPIVEKAAENAGGLRVIIVFHPALYIDKNGQLLSSNNSATIKCFKAICEEHGVLFLDMTDRFLQEYDETYTLPNGFANTPVGTGHLNKYGHAMIAEELFAITREMQ